MKSDAKVVYDESKGKLFLNSGTAKGWGRKKLGGRRNVQRQARVHCRPLRRALSPQSDAITGDDNKGDDIKDEIASLELIGAKVSQLYGETLIDEEGLNSIAKAARKRVISSTRKSWALLSMR